MEDITIKKIFDYSLEEIMGDRFGTYSKYIIQDRAIPDVRDGLKPVQRRVLYAMYMDHNTHDKKFKKCANAVGIILGKYHPHGDSSVYEALVRLSQDWKQTHILVEIDGNNGSIDGDGPAAYRYTECRLSKLSNEVLGDVDKFRDMFQKGDNDANFTLNFDDTVPEPTVLPARFPNLLVNGCTGISAGYATNMAPHNLGEIIDATIKRIDSPNCTLDSILKIVKGPDFPCGGIVEGIDGLRKAYETGKGKITVRCKYEFIREKGKDKIVIDEIPFDVNKANLVKKIDEIRLDKKIDGISEVRDESDKDANIRIVIDLKQGANKELVMNYLLKNTECQTSYNFNNVTIVNRRPRLLGILPILDAYIDYRKETLIKSSKYDLANNKIQCEIEEGLIKAISILDEVIKIIRASKNKEDSKINLCEKFGFSMVQAEAIVTMQLYRLSNTDIELLKERLENLKKEIERLEGIINDPEKLNAELKNDLRRIKKEYAVPRKTTISEEVTEINIAEEDLIKEEDVVIALTKDGYIKRVSKKSYAAAKEDSSLKPGDSMLKLIMASTLDKLMIVTNMGNYLYLPVYQIPDGKWKDMGKHISSIVLTAPSEVAINAFISNDKTKSGNIVIFTKLGMIKKTKLDSYNVNRYNKTYTAIKLKDGDEVVSAEIEEQNNLIVTKNGYYLAFDHSEVPESGPKTSGVKSINLKDDDEVVKGCTYDNSDEYVCVITNKKTYKRVKLDELVILGRAKRGNQIIKKTKTTTYNIDSLDILNTKDTLEFIKEEEIKEVKPSEIPIMDTSSTGSSIKEKYDYIVKKAELEEAKEVNEELDDSLPILKDENEDFLAGFRL